MSIRTIYECNICGAERKEANHWFVAMEIDGEGISIRPWKYSPHVDDEEAKHLCGQACVHSFVDRHIGGPNMPVIPAPPSEEFPQEFGEPLPPIKDDSEDMPF